MVTEICRYPHSNENSTLPEQLNDNQFLIFGDGYRGDKPDQLATKLEIIVNAGFSVPPTVVLSQSFADSYFIHNKIGSSSADVSGPSEKLTKKILQGHFSEEQRMLLNYIFSVFTNENPLIVRGCGPDQGRGASVDLSEIIPRDSNMFEHAIRKVIASEYTSRAFQFRREVHSPLIFGTMIQPVIGNWTDYHEDRYFASLFSGHVYSSTPRIPKGVLTMGIGLDIVNKNHGHRIELNDETQNANLFTYVDKEQQKITYGLDRARRSSLLGLPTGNMSVDSYKLTGDALSSEGERRTINLKTIVSRAMFAIYPDRILTSTHALEQSVGVPQYVEFAIQQNGDKYETYIVQIADVNKKENSIDFLTTQEPLLTADTVTGSVDKIFKSIVVCETEDDLQNFSNFNPDSEIILVLYGHLVSKKQTTDRWDYDNLNKSQVIIEFPNVQHNSSLYDHFKGLMDITGRVLAMLSMDSFDFNNKLERDSTAPLPVYKGNFRVIASEKQNRLVIVQV